MTPRQKKILNIIINRYVQTAEPISSKLLEDSGLFEVSSATLRNEMNDLEREGYLTQPHTSSGRVPTDKGYRFFVDTLVREHELDPTAPWKRKIDQGLEDAGTDPRVVSRCMAQILGDLSDTLVIANLDDSEDVFKVGLSNLFEYPEFREFQRVFQLTDFFDRFEAIFDQLERRLYSAEPQEISIFIGRENPLNEIRDDTMMVGQYYLPNGQRGTITLIGPTRMNYRKNISLIRYAINSINQLSEN